MKIVNWVNDTSKGRLNFAMTRGALSGVEIYVASDLHESILHGLLSHVVNTSTRSGLFTSEDEAVVDLRYRLGKEGNDDSLRKASGEPDMHRHVNRHVQLHVANSNNILLGEEGYVREYGPTRPGVRYE